MLCIADPRQVSGGTDPGSRLQVQNIECGLAQLCWHREGDLPCLPADNAQVYPSLSSQSLRSINECSWNEGIGQFITRASGVFFVSTF